MNWFALVMQGLTMAPGLINHFRQNSSDPGQTKQAKVLDAVMTSVSTLNTLAPDVLAHPKMQHALKVANDAIYYAGQVAQAVGDKTELPSLPATLTTGSGGQY